MWWWKLILAWRLCMTGRPSCRSRSLGTCRTPPTACVAAIMATPMMIWKCPWVCLHLVSMNLGRAGWKGTRFARLVVGTAALPVPRWKVSQRCNSCAAWSPTRMLVSPSVTAKSTPASSTKTACLTLVSMGVQCRLPAAGCRTMPAPARLRGSQWPAGGITLLAVSPSC